jgi:tetratricopeptide (TPR) repeat protein
LWRFWHRRGHLREGEAELHRLLDRPNATAHTRARAKALIGLAGLLYWQLKYEAANRAYEEALTIARSLGDEPLQAELEYSLIYTNALDGDMAAAQEGVAQTGAMYARLGDEMGIASTVMADGMLATMRGEHERAIALLDDAMGRFQAAGNYFGLINTIGMKVRALVELGRLDEARHDNSEYLRIALDAHEPTALSAALLDAASLEALAGNYERAARLVGAGQRQTSDAGGEPPPELVRRFDTGPLLEQSLGAVTMANLVTEGRQMGAEQAVAYALETAQSSGE